MSRAIAKKGNLAVRAQKEDAQAVLSRINALGLLDHQRRVLSANGFVEIPVTESPPGYLAICQTRSEFYRRNPALAEFLKDELSPEELDFLPRGWYLLGKVIIVKIHPRLDEFQKKIAQALLSIYPRCSAVLRDFGIEGQLREPVRQIIAGNVTETVHIENGVSFKLDPLRIMFSQGNLRERIHMSRLGRDEYVVDMFAGIGYFSLPMAVHSRPRKLVAIELNPLAFRFLQENIILNRVEDIVQPVLGNCAEKTPLGEADRVVMGMVQVTDRYLKAGIESLKPGGILHYHQTIPSWLYPQVALQDVVKAVEALGGSAEVLGFRRVKKYSPGVVHAVVDARVNKDF